MDNIYWCVLIRKQAKKDFEDDFFKLMSNAVFRSVKNIEILNFSQQNEEGIIQYQKQKKHTYEW